MHSQPTECLSCVRSCLAPDWRSPAECHSPATRRPPGHDRTWRSGFEPSHQGLPTRRDQIPGVHGNRQGSSARAAECAASGACAMCGGPCESPPSAIAALAGTTEGSRPVRYLFFRIVNWHETYRWTVEFRHHCLVETSSIQFRS